MFSNWFSGDECGQYRTSPHKQRMDQVGSSLLELRYANDVIRQHLHEWLRFSRHLAESGLLLPATDTDTVRQYVARRTAKTSPSRSRVLRGAGRSATIREDAGGLLHSHSAVPTNYFQRGPCAACGVTCDTARTRHRKTSLRTL